MTSHCIECKEQLETDVFRFSQKNFGISLCKPHQKWVRDMELITTPHTIDLYFALKVRGVPAQIEKFDGFKTIDIAVPQAKVNIEVDGGHHTFNSQQALADLKRTYFSFLRGYLTLRIPNALIERNLDETADYLVDFMNENNNREWGRY